MRKRSKYRPKGVIVDTLTHVTSGIKPALTHTGATPMRIRNHDALAALTQGRATRVEMDLLIEAFNMAEALYVVNPKLGADWAKEIRAGQDALYNVALRGATTGRFVVTGPEMAALNLTMDIHEAQLAQATVLEVERGLGVIRARLAKKQARKLPTKPTKETQEL